MMFRDRAIIRLESVDSTNNYAANLVRLSSPPDGSVITAQEQTSGRGQRGAIWQSEPGENIMCSFVFYPSFLHSGNHFYLLKAIALAVRELTEDYTGYDAFIKWPNDIICQNKKVAGMLVEANWNDQRIQSAIVGIGLNVNQKQFDIPQASSLSALAGRPLDTDLVFDRLLEEVDKQMLRLKSGLYSDISRAYREHLYRLGQVASYEYNGALIKAMITGVDENGHLRLHTDHGESLSCDLKEIRFIF